MWQSSTKCFLKMVHSALNNDRFIKQLRFFGAVFLPIYLVWRMRTRIFYFRGQQARQPCLQMIFGFYCFSNRYDVGVKRYFALFNSYGTRVVVVALSFADVVVSATEESVFAVVVVVVVASLAAADEESSVAGFEAAPALVVV